MVLLQHGHAFAGGDDHLARRRLQLAGKHLEEGGLARTVRADDAVAVAGSKLDIDILKKRLAAVGEGDILCCDHGLSVSFFCSLLFRVF